ncbi:hypothetical protein POM88_002006 [Heracleum sosnowskyi]|uniref:DUF4371 domain-containing protein n=1 Tax=Heracleum sosnowskyi TaxID=360622 RepID=A0AAD8JGZ2_9APIA|nr:hypothetical protein POM88_002006 [Heracleum sosnowskyi]
MGIVHVQDTSASSLKLAIDSLFAKHELSISRIRGQVDVLDNIVDDGLNSDQRAEASTLLEFIQSFDFIFSLFFMKTVLGITNELSISLQRKDQDIVNAMRLVTLSKQRLEILRDDGWDDLLGELCSFCENHSILVLSMDEGFQMKGRSRRKTHQVTNLHHYKVEFFYATIDSQL